MHERPPDPAELTTLATAASTPAAPERIGVYKILEPLGEGGFGVVYLAQQTEPVRRRVALKIVKVGMDTKQFVARFEAERQALALMDHPNVARVLDAGATETGRPYFVMEHVPGEPITTYCDRQRLGIAERLSLFIKVCAAVQHAHQKGIIHRDLKPSNVLVAVKDDEPIPKVIDFGVAKALHQKLTENTVFTEQGQMIGTPEYMSPEQAEMTAQDIDTRSDIYSLGVLLYELLTGERPFTSETLRSGGLVEIQRIIREEDPPKPSTRLSGTPATSTATATARSRRADPKTLIRSLRGDLDWIVMKAMEKDRTRRYETAAGLAMDIRRHLDNEPVLAGPPGGAYRARKFIRRHRIGIAAGSAIAIVFVAGAVGIAWQAIRASNALADSEREAAIAHAVNEFLNTDLLAAVAPSTESGRGKDVLMREVLDEAAKRIDDASTRDGRFADKPLVEASIRTTLGRTYRKLGEYQAAEPHLDRAVELRRRELGAEHVRTLESTTALALLHKDQGDFDRSETMLADVLEIHTRRLGPEHPKTLHSMNSLAGVYSNQGRFEDAERLFQDALGPEQRVLGASHPDTLLTMHNLAIVYENLGRLDDAERLYEETLRLRESALGPDHPQTITSRFLLALRYLERGRPRDAHPMLEQVVETRTRILGADHQRTLAAMSEFARACADLDRHDDAERIYRETIAIQERKLGPDHPDTLNAIGSLAIFYKERERFAEAEPLYLRTIDAQSRTLGAEHPYTLITSNNLAEMYRACDRSPDAVPLFVVAIAGAREVWGDDHWITGAFLTSYGGALTALERFDDAERALLEAHGIVDASMETDDERVIGVITALAELYESWARPVDAATWRDRLPPAAQPGP